MTRTETGSRVLEFTIGVHLGRPKGKNYRSQGRNSQLNRKAAIGQNLSSFFDWTYVLCGSGDDMEPVIGGLDVHSLWGREDKATDGLSTSALFSQA